MHKPASKYRPNEGGGGIKFAFIILNSHTNACYLSYSQYIFSQAFIGVTRGSTTHVPTIAANLCFSIIITLREMCRNAGNDLTSTLEFLYTDFLIPIFFLPIYSGVFFFSFSSQAETQDPGDTERALLPPPPLRYAPSALSREECSPFLPRRLSHIEFLLPWYFLS